MPAERIRSRPIPSQALAALTDRLKDVDQLMDAHRAVGGDQRGRRTCPKPFVGASDLDATRVLIVERSSGIGGPRAVDTRPAGLALGWGSNPPRSAHIPRTGGTRRAPVWSINRISKSVAV